MRILKSADDYTENPVSPGPNGRAQNGRAEKNPVFKITGPSEPVPIPVLNHLIGVLKKFSIMDPKNKRKKLTFCYGHTGGSGVVDVFMKVYPDDVRIGRTVVFDQGSAEE